MNWQEKLTKFLNDFEHKNDIAGILVCGSYVTGTPNAYSDLDVHLVLNEDVDYRERGNVIIDGLLIEYFANPPRQIRDYFNEDFQDIRLMSQTQFATGKIVQDTDGIVQKLKEEAKAMIENSYQRQPKDVFPLVKYHLWDMMDDLQALSAENRPDFDFIYHCNLNELLAHYHKFIGHPYHRKTIFGTLTSQGTRDKYLLKTLPHGEIAELILKCLNGSDKTEKLGSYQQLTNEILTLMGGFNIDGFKFKSETSK